MAWVLLALQVLVGIGSLVCFILVLVRMFQAGQTGMGVLCIVLTVCVGIGPLVAFIYGWVKSGEWGLKNVMMAWTGLVVVAIILGAASLALAPRLQG